MIAPKILTNTNIGQGGFDYVVAGYKFTNNYNMENFLEIKFKGKLTFNGFSIGDTNTTKERTFLSEFGVAVEKDGNFIFSDPAARLGILPGVTTGNIGITVSAGGYFELKITTRNYM